MRLSALLTLLPLLLSSSVAYATNSADDVCILLNTDLNVPVGAKNVAGHINNCLCKSQIPDFLNKNPLAKEIVQGLGQDPAKEYFANLFNAQKDNKECHYPAHAVPSYKADRPNDFTCEEGYTPSPSDSPTTCAPNKRRENPTCPDIKADFENCGGCTVASPFENKVVKNCKNLPHVDKVICSRGACNVQSCKDGFDVSPSQDGCVERRRNRTRDVAGESSRLSRRRASFARRD